MGSLSTAFCFLYLPFRQLPNTPFLAYRYCTGQTSPLAYPIFFSPNSDHQCSGYVADSSQIPFHSPLFGMELTTIADPFSVKIYRIVICRVSGSSFFLNTPFHAHYVTLPAISCLSLIRFCGLNISKRKSSNSEPMASAPLNSNLAKQTYIACWSVCKILEKSGSISYLFSLQSVGKHGQNGKVCSGGKLLISNA